MSDPQPARVREESVAPRRPTSTGDERGEDPSPDLLGSLAPPRNEVSSAAAARSPLPPAARLPERAPGIRLFDRRGSGAGSQIEGVHLSDYARILHKRRWTVLTAFVVVVLLVSVYTFTAVPMYQARVEILIEKEAANVVAFKEAFEQNQVADDYYQTQYRILQSRALARRTLEALQLWHHPQFNPPPDESLSVTRLALMPVDVVAGWFKRQVSADVAVANETFAQSAAIDRFLGHVTVAPVRNSRLVDVTFTAAEAPLAARVANGLAQAFIDQNQELKFQSSRSASDWLEAQLAAQRRQVAASEQAVQQYREKTDAVPLEDTQNIVVQRLADLNAAVTRAKTERMQKEAAYDQIRRLRDDRAALDTFPAIVASPFIQQQKAALAELQRQQAQLSDRLGPNHPEMKQLDLAIDLASRKIQGEIGKIVQAMEIDYQQSLAEERNLTTALDEQKQDALALNRKGIEYGVLARDAASDRQIFESLMQRTKETGIAGELRSNNVRIVDPAETPGWAASPNTRNNLLLALFGGAAFAMAVGFCFEYFDNRIKTPDEMKEHFGLPFLGVVPVLSQKTSDAPLLGPDVPASFSESIRAIRTNVLFSCPDENRGSLVITSTGPGEGKTLVATNLAVALAHDGQRVLLIDADMRRPRVHTIFGLSQAPGLSNVIVGQTPTAEAIRTTQISGLAVMTAGVHTPNPAELLGSGRFQQLMTGLEQQFDLVVIDTPPVTAVIDPSVIVHRAIGVVFVVGAEMTTRRNGRRALEQLDHARARFLGAVLNRVDLQHNAYYHSQYCRPEYGDL